MGTNDDLDALPESVTVQRWHATGDYAYPAEERDDGEFVDHDDYARLTTRVQELERENADLREELLHVPSRSEWSDVNVRAERAESELAAIRKRIAAWEFQHEETGRITIVSNDGVNTLENFTKNNPRWQYVGQLYSALLPLDDEAKS